MKTKLETEKENKMNWENIFLAQVIQIMQVND